MNPNSSIDSLRGRVERLNQAKQPVVRQLIATTVLVCLLVLATAAGFIWWSRQVQIEQTTVSMSNVARMVEVQAESVLRMANLALLDMAERVERDGATGPAGLRLRAHLGALARATPELHGLFVYAADGTWLATSLPQSTSGNNADREYFRFHRDHPGRALRIGYPVRSRSTGVWVLPVSRRLEHADGSFAGVALVTLRINFFEEIYGPLDVGRNGTVLFAIDDGTLVYRRPFDERLVGHAVPHGGLMRLMREHGPVGSGMLVSPVDGIERLYSYRRLQGYPLMVAVGRAKGEVLADWAHAALLVGSAALALTLTFVFRARRLIIQIAIRDRLHAKLDTLSGDLERSNAALAALARTDSLTRLANRHRFDEVLDLELGRARRSGAALSLVLLDVDHFKAYNDSLGHVAGDDCLGAVAGVLAHEVARAGDLAARYGGEEFGVILPATDAAGALAVAQRLREGIRALGIAHPSAPRGVVTASFGVITAWPGAHDSLAARALVAAADQQLYWAKEGGRDRVCGALFRSDEAA